MPRPRLLIALLAALAFPLAAVAQTHITTPREAFGASFGDTTSVTLSRNSHSETISLDGLGRVLK